MKLHLYTEESENSFVENSIFVIAVDSTKLIFLLGMVSPTRVMWVERW